MGLVTLYVNGTERACRTKIFTGSATDATLFIHDREPGRIRNSGHGRHHLNGSRRTMTGTVSTFHTVCIHYTILIYEHGMTNLYGRFFSHRQGAYGTVRTNLGTSYTFRTAIPSFVRHFRLHPRFYRRRRTQDIIGASRYTQLTGRAMRSKIVHSLRSRRF